MDRAFREPTQPAGERTSATYFADHVRIPESATLPYTSTSFTLRADVQILPGGADGVIICIGGAMAGWSLYTRDGIPAFTYNYLGHELTTITGPDPIREGRAVIGLSFDYDGGGLGKGANITLSVDGDTVADGRAERTVPFRFSMSGETLDVGWTPVRRWSPTARTSDSADESTGSTRP